MQANRWGAGSLTADSLNLLSVAGSFGADLTLTGEGVPAGKATLKTARIAGAVTGSTFAVASTVNSFTTWTFENSKLLAGFVPTNASDPFAGGTFMAEAKINSFRILGERGVTDPAFVNSFAAATSFGTVSLKSIEGLNGGEKFGLLADETIAKLSVFTPSLSLKQVEATLDLTVDYVDFEVRVV